MHLLYIFIVCLLIWLGGVFCINIYAELMIFEVNH